MAKAASVRDLLCYASEHRVSITTAAQRLKAPEGIRQRAKDLQVCEEELDESLEYFETIDKALSKFK